MAKKQKDDGVELPSTEPEVKPDAALMFQKEFVAQMAATIYVYHRECGHGRETAISWAVTDAKDLARALAEV